MKNNEDLLKIFVKNPKGEGFLFDKTILTNWNNHKTYVTSAACMSLWSEGLSYANSVHSTTKNPAEADHIVLLCCQVTDLAILNDFQIAEDLVIRYPGKRYFIGGCLARRFDIELPYPWERIDSLREDYVDLKDTSLVNYEKPFWVPGFRESKNPLAEGNIFRNSYPLRIGVGCAGKCKYCTIKWTRGTHYEMNNFDVLEKQFKEHEDVVLIADAPSVFQIKAWCEIAKRNNKLISFRNVEPQVLVKCTDDVINLANLGLLSYLHSPLQSMNMNVLAAMNRNYAQTILAFEIMEACKGFGTRIATNIIIDYRDENGRIMSDDFTQIYKLFDYVSWNPYWAGKWDRLEAEARHKKYIVDKDFTIPGESK